MMEYYYYESPWYRKKKHIVDGFEQLLVCCVKCPTQMCENPF
jgi:hypothetical protein